MKLNLFNEMKFVDCWAGCFVAGLASCGSLLLFLLLVMGRSPSTAIEFHSREAKHFSSISSILLLSLLLAEH